MASYSSELTGGVDENAPARTIRVLAKVATSRHVAKRHSMKAINACLLFCSLIAMLLGLSFLVFDPIVKHFILKKLVLRSNSDFVKLWQNPPVTPELKVYVFNLTNPQEFFDGKEKPDLREVGPYVYHQRWVKENIRWHPNGTMSFQSKKQYVFKRELSVGDHAKMNITTFNVPVVTAYYSMRKADFLKVWGLETVLSSLEYKVYVTKTVQELVWGYEEPMFELAKTTMPDPPKSTKFGLFAEKNVTQNLPTYTMHTGKGDPYTLSKIHLFNGKSHLNFWKTDQCNLVQGSDGATFNPYIRETDTLWFFNDQLCRSLPLAFSRRVVASGLPGFRFVPREDVFMSPSTWPENACYCEDETLCNMIGDGLFPLSKCQFGAPIVLSWPHFLHAEPRFVESVRGLRPMEKRHSFFFDVQPTTGTTLAAQARFQINLAIKQSQTFDEISKVNDSVVPMMWFEEGVDELSPDLKSMIGQAVTMPPQYKSYLLCVFLGLLVSTLVIGSVAIVRKCLNARHKDVLFDVGVEDTGDADFDDDPIVATVRKTMGSIIKQHHRNDSMGARQPMLMPDESLDLSMNNKSGINTKLLISSDSSTTASSSGASTANHSRNSSSDSDHIRRPEL